MAVTQGDDGISQQLVLVMYVIRVLNLVACCVVSLAFMLTERGSMFGYGDLVVDVRNLPKLRRSNGLVVQDVTHRCGMQFLSGSSYRLFADSVFA